MTIKVDPSNEEPQRLRCGNCGKWLVLSIEDQNVAVEELTLECRMPFLRCLDCDSIYVPDRSFGGFLRMLKDVRTRGETRGRLATRLEEVRSKRFPFCKEVEFKYDPLDYYYLPGLIRPSSSGFLTPVFFS